MAQRRSSDLRDSLYLVFLVGGLFALVLLGPRLFPKPDGPLWKNIYLFSATHDDAYLPCLWVLSVLNNGLSRADSRIERLWSSGFLVVGGLASVVAAASFVPTLIPHLGLAEGVISVCLGILSAAAVRDGVPGRAWQNLFADGIDYARRFFPIVGVLLGLACLGLAGWQLYHRAQAHDYMAVADAACFALGIVSVLIAGKRRPTRFTPVAAV